MGAACLSGAQKALRDNGRTSEQSRSVPIDALERAFRIEAILEYNGGVPICREVHLHHSRDARERAHQEEDGVLVGAGDEGHVRCTCRQRVQRVQDALGASCRAGSEKHH